MLNYAFDPTIVNPVSARVGQQVMGGIRFAGVDGAPDRPWKLDKDNWQARVGMAYSINEKTVLRAGYGKYFLNPTSQGNNAGFSLAIDVIASTDGGRTPTSLLSNPWPNGIQTPPGSSPARRPSSAAARTSRTPTSSCRTSTSSPVGVQRELPWRISLEATVRGKPQLRPGSRFQRLQRAVGGVPGAVRRHPGRQPHAVRPASCRTRTSASAGFEGTTRFTDQTLSRFELNRPFPAFGGITRNQNNIGKLIYDSAQFVANKRWAKGVTINASYTYVPRWSEIGGYVDAVSDCLNEGLVPHRRIASRGQACGNCRGTATSAAFSAISLAGGRLRRRSSTSPASRGTCPATSTWRRASTSR